MLSPQCRFHNNENGVKIFLSKAYEILNPLIHFLKSKKKKTTFIMRAQKSKRISQTIVSVKQNLLSCSRCHFLCENMSQDALACTVCP